MAQVSSGHCSVMFRVTWTLVAMSNCWLLFCVVCLSAVSQTNTTKASGLQPLQLDNCKNCPPAPLCDTYDCNTEHGSRCLILLTLKPSLPPFRPLWNIASAAFTPPHFLGAMKHDMPQLAARHALWYVQVSGLPFQCFCCCRSPPISSGSSHQVPQLKGPSAR